MIDFVSRRTESLGIGLVLTTRGPIPADHGGSEIRMNPLPADIAAALVVRRAEVPPEVVRRIVELAGGNPLGSGRTALGASPPSSSRSPRLSASRFRFRRPSNGPASLASRISLKIPGEPCYLQPRRARTRSPSCCGLWQQAVSALNPSTRRCEPTCWLSTAPRLTAFRASPGAMGRTPNRATRRGSSHPPGVG